MTPPVLHVNGQQLRLGKRIGKGGEGEVYLLDDKPSFAAKLYTVPNLTERERKIEAMLRSRLWERFPLVMFPSATIRKKDGSFAGLIMRAVSGHQPLHELYAPGARKNAFPSADYRFLVRAALNIATAVSQVHEAGCVIGDINHSGFLISDKAISAVIDADSFQYSDGKQLFPCHVGVPEYTPPELQGVALSSTPRTANHDAFGLSVIIFQLLFMGKHPYAGVYTGGDMPLEKAIRENRFAYSLRRSVGMTPPPAASDLTDVPKPIADAFETAFGPPVGVRPSAKQWVALLNEFERSLRRCGTNQAHFYSSAATACPWCAMETITGATLFISQSTGQTNSFRAKGAPFSIIDTRALWAKLDGIKFPDAIKAEPGFVMTSSPVASQSAQAVKSAGSKNKFGIFAGIAVALIATVILPQIWPLTIGAGALTAWAFYKDEATGDVWDRFRKAKEDWEGEVQRWRNRIGFSSAHNLRNNLQQNLLSYDGLTKEKADRIAQYAATRQSDQLDAYLDRFRISTASISGIGPTKTAQLASFGIETAADIDSSALLAVPGFGPVNSKPLLGWRAALERNFVYKAQHTPADMAEYQRIEAEFVEKEARLRERITSGLSELETLSTKAFERIKAKDPSIISAAEALSQAIADLKFLGLNVPQVSFWPPQTGGSIPLASFPSVSRHPTSNSGTPFTTQGTPPRPQTTAQSPTAAKQAVPSCPQCGSTMVRRVAKRGARAGKPFWGCTKFPRCRGTLPI